MPGHENSFAYFLSRYPILKKNTLIYNIKPIKESYLELVAEAYKGYFGIRNTIDRLKNLGHNWPSIREEVQQFIKYCDICQRFQKR